MILSVGPGSPCLVQTPTLPELWPQAASLDLSPKHRTCPAW